MDQSVTKGEFEPVIADRTPGTVLPPEPAADQRQWGEWFAQSGLAITAGMTDEEVWQTASSEYNALGQSVRAVDVYNYLLGRRNHLREVLAADLKMTPTGNPRAEVESAVRAEIKQYLGMAAYNWATGDAVYSLDAGRELKLTNRVAEVFGDERVRSIWAEIDRDIRLHYAAEARLVVPGYVVDAWLDGEETVLRPEIDAEAREALGPDGVEPLDWKNTFWGIFGDSPDAPEFLVAQGLHLLEEIRHTHDRDHFDQLGLPEAMWDSLTEKTRGWRNKFSESPLSPGD